MPRLAPRVRALGSLVLPLLALAVGCGSSDDDDGAAAGSSGSSGQSSSVQGGAAGSSGGAGQPGGGSAGATASKGLALTAAGADATTCQLTQTLGGPAATCVVTVTNRGATPVTFAASPVSLSGPDASRFTVATPPAGTLAAGASTTLTVSFVAADEGAREATLTVASDSPEPAPTLALEASGSCPTKAPVDLTVPVVRDHCTRTLYVGVGQRTRRIVSTDLTTWSHDQLDHTNCLTNQDGSFNCWKNELFDCTTKDPATCTDLGGGSLDCSSPNATDPTRTDCAGFDDSAFNAAFGLGLIVTASDFGIFTSADAGATWTKAPAPAPQQWGSGGAHVSSVAFGNGVFVVATEGHTYTSSDGFVWEHSTDKLGGGYYGFGDLVFGGGHFVAVGGKTVILKVSEDGKTWHDAVPLALTKLAHGNGRFVGVGDGLRATSLDGTNWQTTTDVCTAAEASKWTGPPEQCLGKGRTTAWDGSRFVACGNRCLQSTDGTTWTALPDVKAKGFNSMIFVDGRYLAGGGSSVSTSPDLVTWTSHDLPTDTIGGSHGVSRVAAGLVLRASATP